jgi:hypothetical protein
MKIRTITARVTEKVNSEIEFLKSSLGLPSTTSVLNYAIHRLYEIRKEEESRKSSLEMFEERGLFGCIEASSDLSTNYKQEMTKVVQRKHAHNPSKKKPGIRKSEK